MAEETNMQGNRYKKLWEAETHVNIWIITVTDNMHASVLGKI